MIDISQDPESSTDPLRIVDPLEEYEFEVEVDATGYKEEYEMTHQLFATRHYTDIKNISAIYPFNMDLAALIDQFITTRVVEQGTGEEIDGRGVNITTVFESDPTGHYNPVDILISGIRIGEFDVSAGFWRIDSRLAQLINTQTRGLNHHQTTYTGQKNDIDPPATIHTDR